MSPRTRALRWLVTALAAALAWLSAACGPTDPGGSTPCADCQPVGDCDAGDEAWVALALEAVQGRRPEGIAEARVLAQLSRRIGRAAVVRLLAAGDDYEARWVDFFARQLAVDRVNPDNQRECFGDRHFPNDDGAAARWIRDHGAADASPYPDLTMRDVIHSALRADDLSPLYRANLFAMVARPAKYCGNTPPAEMDLARRRQLGERFTQVYTHTGLTCLTCHSTSWSTTDSAIEADDRFWPLPGDLATPVYGPNDPSATMTIYSSFRYRDVIARDAVWSEEERQKFPTDAAPAIAPFGFDLSCGHFVPPADVPEDLASLEGFFIEPLGPSPSVWSVEASLRRGVDAVRAAGETLDAETAAQTGDTAFAYLLASRIAHQVWLDVAGTPLTLPHFFPRHPEQRDIWMDLTQRVVASDYSLVELLVAVLTHPLVNLESPAAGCGATYPLAPVFDPFSVDALDPEEHGNSSADGAHGVQASTLLRLTTRALGWEHPDLFSDLVVTMPATVFDSSTRSVGLAISGVDSQLLLMFRALFRTCSERLGAAHEDWVQRLLDAALADPTATVGDVAAALKDRLLIAPDIEPVTEAPLVADVFGVPDLDTPAAEAASLASGARIYCGALLSSPQFALRGLPEPAQTGTPRLVVDGADFQNLCERYTAGVPGLQCGEATLTVATPGG